VSIWFMVFFFFFSSRRRHTRFSRDWSSDVCSSDLLPLRPRLGHRDELATLAVDPAALHATLRDGAFAPDACDAVGAELLRQSLAAAKRIALVLGLVTGSQQVAAAGGLASGRGLARAVLPLLVRQAADAQRALGLVAVATGGRRLGRRRFRGESEDRGGRHEADEATARPRRPVDGSIEHGSSSWVRISV